MENVLQQRAAKGTKPDQQWLDEGGVVTPDGCWMEPSECCPHGQRTFAVGNIVRYAKPQAGEADCRFVVREVNGDRLLMTLMCDWPIPPTETVRFTDVELV